MTSSNSQSLKRSFRRLWFVLWSLALTFAVFATVYFNSTPATISIVENVSIDLPLGVALLVALTLGFSVGYIFAWVRKSLG